MRKLWEEENQYLLKLPHQVMRIHRIRAQQAHHLPLIHLHPILLHKNQQDRQMQIRIMGQVRFQAVIRHQNRQTLFLMEQIIRPVPIRRIPRIQRLDPPTRKTPSIQQILVIREIPATLEILEIQGMQRTTETRLITIIKKIQDHIKIHFNRNKKGDVGKMISHFVHISFLSIWFCFFWRTASCFVR